MADEDASEDFYDRADAVESAYRDCLAGNSTDDNVAEQVVMLPHVLQHTNACCISRCSAATSSATSLGANYVAF